jgi:hypothetical protein
MILSWLSEYFIGTSIFIRTTVSLVTALCWCGWETAGKQRLPQKEDLQEGSLHWERWMSVSGFCQKSSAISKQKCHCIKNILSYGVLNTAWGLKFPSLQNGYGSSNRWSRHCKSKNCSWGSVEHSKIMTMLTTFSWWVKRIFFFVAKGLKLSLLGNWEPSPLRSEMVIVWCGLAF